MTDETAVPRRPDEQLYVGPRPYEQKDARIFFGREREARDLVSLVIANPLLLLYAPSGAGKTSLVNARLIPMLGRVEDPELRPMLGPGKGFDVMPTARVSGLIPDGIDFGSVPGANIYAFNTLLSWRRDERPAGLGGQAELVGVRLADYLDRTLAPRDPSVSEEDEEGHPPPRIAFFDQFEEIFTSHFERWEDRAGFFEQLSDALRGGPVMLRLRDVRLPGALLARVAAGQDPVSLMLYRRLPDAARGAAVEFAGAPAVPAAQLRPLVEAMNGAISSDAFDEMWRRGALELSERARELAGRTKQGSNNPALNRLILEDTYPEELYPRSRGDRTLRVVLSMREDYIAELDPYAHLLPDRLGTRYRLERLRRDAALIAVTSPLRYTHLRFADGVAERLVENLLKTPLQATAGRAGEEAPAAPADEDTGHDRQ